MRLSDPIDASGFFWIPGEETGRLPGRLSITSAGRIELNLTALSDTRQLPAKGLIFGEPAFHSGPLHHKRIVGLITTEQLNDHITLEDCHYVASNTSLEAGLSSSTIEATHAFIGAAFSADSDISLSELRFSTTALDEWLDISGVGISHEFGQNNRMESITIQYSTPAKREYSLPNNMTLEINFDSTIPLGS